MTAAAGQTLHRGNGAATATTGSGGGIKIQITLLLDLGVWQLGMLHGNKLDLDKLDRYSKFKEETNANRMKILEMQQKLSSEKLEATKLANLTAQETKKGKKLDKESKMMEACECSVSVCSMPLTVKQEGLFLGAFYT
uniref:Uncharacterized protein n=1 Tax=Leersia perrieri TaxID=77586 RepID=A0A0D9VUW0_9ORYZ